MKIDHFAYEVSDKAEGLAAAGCPVQTERTA
jgi:hypothetical protein